MELALSALASFGTAAAATGGEALAAGAIGGGAAGAGAAVVPAAGGLAGLGASTWGILSGASTAVSVLQTLRAGNIQAQDYAFKAKEAGNEAIGEEAAGAQRATRLKRELLRTLGENDVAYAASGVDLSVGDAATRRSMTEQQAYGEIATDRATTEARVAGFEARNLAYSRMSRQARTGALLSALAMSGEATARIARRGY